MHDVDRLGVAQLAPGGGDPADPFAQARPAPRAFGDEIGVDPDRCDVEHGRAALRRRSVRRRSPRPRRPPAAHRCARSTVSMPAARAKWLKVPPGSASSGRSSSSARCAIRAMDPSPPYTPRTRGGSAPAIASRTASAIGSSGSSSRTTARGRRSAMIGRGSVRTTAVPASLFITMSTPAPSEDAGSSIASTTWGTPSSPLSSATRGERTGGGHSAEATSRDGRPLPGALGRRRRFARAARSPPRTISRPRTATPAPIATPPTTSESQWAPTCMREYATAAASGAITAPARGRLQRDAGGESGRAGRVPGRERRRRRDTPGGAGSSGPRMNTRSPPVEEALHDDVGEHARDEHRPDTAKRRAAVAQRQKRRRDRVPEQAMVGGMAETAVGAVVDVPGARRVDAPFAARSIRRTQRGRVRARRYADDRMPQGRQAHTPRLARARRRAHAGPPPARRWLGSIVATSPD